MKILLTGAAGFIGSHTAQALVERGHQVIGLDSFDDYLYPSQVKRDNAAALAQAVDPTRFELIEGNICDEAVVGDVLGGRDIDVVCHLAALAGVRPSLRQPLRYIETNLRGTNVLLEACRHAGVHRFVFGSSSSVYGSKPSEVEPFRESDPCLHPASPYAASKRAGELLCSTYRDLYGIGVSSLRFFTVYGPRQRPDMAIHKFVRAVATGAPITLFGDGSSRRDYTFVADIVAGILAACDAVEPGSYEIYNLGGSETTRLADLVRIIERVVGKPAVIHHEPEQPGDVPITFADISKAQRALGYQPTIDVATGVTHFWAWYQTSRRG